MASGFSKRMGCNKLLLENCGVPMIAHTFNRIKPFEFREVLVVTAYDAIMAMAGSYGYRVIRNPAPEAGQSRSVVLGVAASPDSEGWLFFSGDMPWLLEDTIGRLLELAVVGQNKIIVPRYGGQPGQPVYFPASYRSELLSLSGDKGGRQIMMAHPGQVQYLDVADRRQGMDIDTPKDYEYYRKETAHE